MKKIVVLSGAGVSAESGLRTFRDHDGLWEGYSIHEVATPEAWERNPELVLRFYNERRRALAKAEPNSAHRALVDLERKYSVVIVTQNVDDLHERAGSSSVLHLHGELTKARSSLDLGYLRSIEYQDLALGDQCPKGGQLRPHIVWFGEAVPMIDRAVEEVRSADYVIVVGTSLLVYPAAGLLSVVRPEVPIVIVDPKRPAGTFGPQIRFIDENAGIGVPKLVVELLG